MTDGQTCSYHGGQCDPVNEFCASNPGDNIRRCRPLPTRYYNAKFHAWANKAGKGAVCDEFIKCNEFQNLVCTKSSYAGDSSGVCDCQTKYHYYNSTTTALCVIGAFYSQVCTSDNQCVPASAGFKCDYLTGASTSKTCLCNGTTPFYDYYNEKCTARKVYNTPCNSSYECADAYGTATASGVGNCGL